MDFQKGSFVLEVIFLKLLIVHHKFSSDGIVVQENNASPIIELGELSPAILHSKR